MTIKISDEIKKYRLKNGLSQKDLAQATGLSQGYISGLEKGARTPSLAILDNIAKHLGIDVVKLFSYEELEQEKAAVDEVVKMMSIVDNWLESNKLKMNRDNRDELVVLLLEDYGGKTFDDERIKKIEKKISRIIKIGRE